MKFDVITVGGATEDVAFYTSEGTLLDNRQDILKQKLIAFEYGAKINIEKPYFGFGGGSANTAVCFSRLGFKAACLTAVGNDNRGDKIIENLRFHGVDAGLVKKIKGKNSGLSFVLICQKNERIIFSDRGANSYLELTPADQADLQKSKWLFVCSLSGKWENTLKRIFAGKKSLVAWNPGHFQLSAGYQRLKKYLQLTDVLILNKDEALELVFSAEEMKKEDHEKLNNIKKLIKIIKSWCPGLVVITDGQRGAYADDGRRTYFQKPYPASKMVDKTGVGDAFGSSFVAGLEVYGGDIQKSLALGVRTAAKILAKQGAQNGLAIKRIK